jgi:hypothetical protein
MVFVFAVCSYTFLLPTPLAIIFCALAFVFLIGSVAANTYYLHEVWATLKNATIQGNTTVPSREVPFVWAAEWIRNNTPTNATFLAYPNLAICLFLAERLSHDFFPNFLGTKEDFDAMITSITNGSGPDYVLISPVMYPYMGPSAYFFLPQPVIEGLNKTYVLAAQCNSQNGASLIAVYKKKIPPQSLTMM